MLNIIIDKSSPGKNNMQIDENLFLNSEKNILPPTLRLYQWSPQCISLGYSQKPKQQLSLTECKKQNWDIVQRITGGGIVFHNINEITYSLFINKDHPKLPKGIIPSCNFISKILVKTLNNIGIKNAAIAENKGLGSNRANSVCFSRPTKYEIVINGKKIIGNAQKRGKKTLLQHGSICIKKNPGQTSKCLLKETTDNSLGIKDILANNYNQKLFIDKLINNFQNIF